MLNYWLFIFATAHETRVKVVVGKWIQVKVSANVVKGLFRDPIKSNQIILIFQTHSLMKRNNVLHNNVLLLDESSRSTWRVKLPLELIISMIPNSSELKQGDVRSKYGHLGVVKLLLKGLYLLASQRFKSPCLMRAGGQSSPSPTYYSTNCPLCTHLELSRLLDVNNSSPRWDWNSWPHDS